MFSTLLKLWLNKKIYNFTDCTLLLFHTHCVFYFFILFNSFIVLLTRQVVPLFIFSIFDHIYILLRKSLYANIKMNSLKKIKMWKEQVAMIYPQPVPVHRKMCVLLYHTCAYSLFCKWSDHHPSSNTFLVNNWWRHHTHKNSAADHISGMLDWQPLLPTHTSG